LFKALKHIKYNFIKVVMRKYEFSLAKESRRLPPVSKWIDPNFEGEISTFDHELGKEITFPKNWRTDFPIYDYKISVFGKIDYWPYVGESIMKDVSQKFNVEQACEKWIDFYEIFSSILGPVLDKSAKRRNRSRAYRSFHSNNTEAIYALNHLVKTQYPGAFWEWNASTNRIITRTPYLDAEIAKELYKTHPAPWAFGVEGDGNLQSPDNIRSISNTLDPVQLFTAPLSLGTVICMAQILSRDGIAVFSADQIDTTFRICLIYILSCCFETFSVARPNSNSDDFYYIGEQFKGMTKSHLERLEQILRYTDSLDDPPAIFPKDKIASEFIVEFSSAITKATMRRKKKDISWWIETTGIQPLREHAKLLNA
jgi:hypothetical protein